MGVDGQLTKERAETLNDRSVRSDVLRVLQPGRKDPPVGRGSERQCRLYVALLIQIVRAFRDQGGLVDVREKLLEIREAFDG